MLQNRGLVGFWAALGRFWVTGGLPDASKTHVDASGEAFGLISDRCRRVLEGS